jgi:hypothetical protein
MQKRLRLSFLILSPVPANAAYTQLQPFLLKSLGAMDGSFGIPPMSHTCAGQRLSGASIDWLAAVDYRFKVGVFSVRDWVDQEGWPERPYCIEQDIWFGEYPAGV